MFRLHVRLDRCCVEFSCSMGLFGGRILITILAVSLRRRPRNLTSVSNVCEAVPSSLFWAPNGLNELPEVRFEFPFILIGKSTMAFFNRPIMARTQILVHRWGSRTRISALFRRPT